MRIRNAGIAAGLFVLTFSLPSRAANYTDWWWGGLARDGEGVNVGQQADTVFVSWFTYDEQGNGMWVVFSGPLDGTGKIVNGLVYRTTGPALGTTYDPAKVNRMKVGNATLTFSDMHHATLDWSVNGKSGSLALVRETYGGSSIAGTFDGYTDGNLHCPGMGYYGMPTDTPVHSKGSLTISAAGGQASGSALFDAYTCSWTGAYAQSGQMVHVTGSASCPMLGTASIDLTLFVLDRAIVGWQNMSSMSNGCMQIEQFSMVRNIY
jgi:hypothetical protein